MSPEEVADDAPPVELAVSPPTPEFEMAPATVDAVEESEAPVAEEEPSTLVELMPTLASGFDSRAAATPPEPTGEEISWQLEEAGEGSEPGAAPSGVSELAGLAEREAPVLAELPATAEMSTAAEALESPGSPWLSATPTHEIPLSPPAPDLAAAERFADAAAAAASAASEWREVEETTAPHSTFSPAATQRFAAVTNEFPQSDVAAPAPFAPPPAPPEPALASSASTIAFIPSLAPTLRSLQWKPSSPRTRRS